MTRAAALQRLARFGIRGADVYLIDLIPLVEMIWADGERDEGEVDELRHAVRGHVARLNRMAGYAMLDEAGALAFVERFLRERPDPALLAELRTLVAPLRLASSDPQQNEQVRQSLLASCLHIAARSPVPGSPERRISRDERRTFFEILDALEPRPPARRGEAGPP